MRQVWLITDTHFNHDKMIQYCGRPPDFTEKIISNWQKMVAPNDIVIHLGDVIFNRASEVKSILSRLPGYKILILGNHDYHHSENWWLENGFDMVCQEMVYKNVLLSHYPKECRQKCLLNVHGHFHNNPSSMWDAPTYPHSKLLAIENTDYKPVLFSEFTEEEKRTANKKVVLV